MNWNDWEMVWKRQELPRGAEADLATLRQTFEAKSRKLATALLVRDGLEAAAGLFVAGVLAIVWWGLGGRGWPIALGIGLILGVTGFFVRERIRVHRAQCGAGAPLLARLDAELAELRHQRRLLLGIWKWYLAPITAAIVITCLTIRANLPAWSPGRDPLFLGGYFLLVALLMLAVWALNRRAVRQRLEPRIAELEKLRSNLLSP